MRLGRAEEFGLFVTSNASLSHIEVGEKRKTFCGLSTETFNAHPNSETRWYASEAEFKKFVAENRFFIDPGYRLCRRCLKAFDKLTGTDLTLSPPLKIK